jgi:hypothetical protein
MASSLLDTGALPDLISSLLSRASLHRCALLPGLEFAL